MIVTTVMKKWLVCVICCLLLGGALAPGETQADELQTGKLKGFIYKANGKTPLWGAEVLLKNTRTGQLFESNVTDSVGDFLLENIPQGDYKIQISVKDKNYQVKKLDFLVKIMAGKTSTLSFALKKYRKLPFFLRLKWCHVVGLLASLATFGVLVL